MPPVRAGPSNKLLFQAVGSETRKLMRRAKIEMDLKLGRAGVMLRNFLEDDLSESHIGLTNGGRAHLERFRCFLLAFFTARLGYYPPDSMDSRSLIFEPKVYRLMRDDFQALYGYLVDSSFTISEDSPMLAQGGICTLQSVHGFDVRNKLTPLPHPLPLLPDMVLPSPKSRRISWLPKGRQAQPRSASCSRTGALAKATNHTDPAVMDNELVIAYRRFEEDSVCTPLKVDRAEKVSQVDARKIRWILVYAIYQILKSCTDSPPECQDLKGANYNVAISTANLPPWKESRRVGRRAVACRPCAAQYPWGPCWGIRHLSLLLSRRRTSLRRLRLEMRPDIDYFALRNQLEEPRSRKARGVSLGPPVRLSSLQGGLKRSLSLSGTVVPYPSPSRSPGPCRGGRRSTRL